METLSRVLIGFVSSDAQFDDKGGLEGPIEKVEFHNGNTYAGEWHQGEMHGRGAFTWSERGITYKGVFNENHATGVGTLLWPDGSQYHGDVVDGMRDGWGVYVSGQLTCFYAGDWANGHRHGRGQLHHFASKDDLLDAVAELVQQAHDTPSVDSVVDDDDEEDDLVEGAEESNDEEAASNAPSGNDAHFFPSLSRFTLPSTAFGRRTPTGETSCYDGEWCNDQKEGQGTMTYRNGNMYDGEWHANQRHGQGTMVWHTRLERYAGHWRNGKQDGVGEHIWMLAQCSCSDDDFAFHLHNRYIGEWSNGVRNGRGTFFYADGAQYSGEWRNGRKEGSAYYLYADGRMFSGEFANDQMCGTPAHPLNEKRDAVHLLDIADITCTLLKLNDSEARYEEKALCNAVVRHIVLLRRVYTRYASTSTFFHRTTSPLVLSRLQLWRLLLDCRATAQHTLAALDRTIALRFSDTNTSSHRGSDCSTMSVYLARFRDPHNPSHVFLLREFIDALIRIAVLLYASLLRPTTHHPSALLASCLTHFIDVHLSPLPSPGGLLFTSASRLRSLAPLQNSLYAFFQASSMSTEKSLVGAPNDRTLTRRALLRLLHCSPLVPALTTQQTIARLWQSHDCGKHTDALDTDIEMVYLEFIEALLTLTADEEQPTRTCTAGSDNSAKETNSLPVLGPTLGLTLDAQATAIVHVAGYANAAAMHLLRDATVFLGSRGASCTHLLSTQSVPPLEISPLVQCLSHFVKQSINVAKK